MSKKSVTPRLAVLASLACLMALSHGRCVRGSFVPEEQAIFAAEAEGLSQVQVEDHSWFAIGLRGCSQRDAAKFVVSGVTKEGSRTTLTICVDWPLRGATIQPKPSSHAEVKIAV